MKTIKRSDLNKEYQAIVSDEPKFWPDEYIAHGSYCYCNFGGYVITLSNDSESCIIVGDLGGDTVAISEVLEIEWREDLENEDEENDLIVGVELDGSFYRLQDFMKI